MRLAGLAHDDAQRFLGAGLAHRPGHRDDPGLRACPRRGAEALERRKHVMHDEEAGRACEGPGVGLVHNRGRRAILEGTGDKVVAVEAVARGSRRTDRRA